jgi:hypothetical protein
MQTPTEQTAHLAATESRLGPSASNLRAMFTLKYGRRAGRLLGNEGEDFLNIPGVAENAARAANLNSSNFAKGYLRNHLYARAIYGNSDFQLLGADRPIETASGKTDMDLVFREKSTGQEFRMEVKNVREENITRNIEKYKIQINKMAEDARDSGREQIWANRQQVPSSLRQYAGDRGVRVFDNVVTGDKSRLRPGAQTMTDVLNKIKDPPVDEHDGAGAVRGGGPLATHDSVGAEGGLIDPVEGALEGGTLAGAAWLPRAMEIGGKVIGFVGAAALVGYWGYTAYEWEHGRISTRQFATTTASIGGGFAGAVAVAAIGTLIGPEGTAAGGLIGGALGVLYGGAAAGYAVGSYYQFEDNKFGRHQQTELMQFLTQYYSKPVAAGNR